jgi:hypothetical protein
MQGFDACFNDLPDYILKCTAQIWEGRDIAALHWHYGDDLRVRTPAGISRGNAAGIANTMATLCEFPDRELLGEDVIWTGNASDGFLSSHRILSNATHRGGWFGDATAKRVTFRTIADTFCHANRVWDEWLIRDNAAIVCQIGGSPKQAAQAQIDRGDLSMPLTPETDEVGPYTGSGNTDPWGSRHADGLRAIMSADFGTIPKIYDRACHISAPEGQESHGWAALDAFWLGLRSAFPDAVFRIDHQIGRMDPMLPPRSAVRWSLTGHHSGFGRYGAPSGASVHVMGVSHVEFGPRGIRRDVTLFDDIAIWKQILLHTTQPATG